VGSTVQDLCRACKMVRRHTVMAAGGGRSRVICEFCGSQHNYRGGERAEPPARGARPPAPSPALVHERERSNDPMHDDDPGASPADLEPLLRRIIREEAGITPVAPAPRWRGGELVLRPGRAELQEKSWPIETFFSKIVMIRNRLRTLEQQLNAAELPADLKLKLQGYVTGCYGSLTSFNVLFAEDEDRFRGAAGGD